MGQGIHIKMKQIIAHCLGVELSKIVIAANSTAVLANSFFTGGSWGTDENGKALQIACNQLLERLKPIKDSLLQSGLKNPSLAEIAEKALAEGVNLSSQAHYQSEFVEKNDYSYFSYGAAVSEVELDVLTGDTRTLRTDILFDCGKSINPAVDIGQVEGGFIQGLGWLTSEQVRYLRNGKLLSSGSSSFCFLQII